MSSRLWWLIRKRSQAGQRTNRGSIAHPIANSFGYHFHGQIGHCIKRCLHLGGGQRIRCITIMGRMHRTNGDGKPIVGALRQPMNFHLAQFSIGKDHHQRRVSANR